MTRQEVDHFYIMGRYIIFFKFYITVEFHRWNIHTIAIWGQDETFVWSGNERSHSFSDKMRTVESSMTICETDGNSWCIPGHCSSAKKTKTQVQNVLEQCRWAFQGVHCLQEKGTELSSLSDHSSRGSISPQLVSSRISPQRPKQQLSLTSAPSKREAGWPLSPCQDVLIAWMLRIRAYILGRCFYSRAASHTSFSGP